MDDFKQLGRVEPDDPDDPHGDLATLRELEAAGADLSKPTSFIHYIVFPGEQEAHAGGRLIAENLGYDVSGGPAGDPGGQWLVRAEREQIPTAENVERMRQALPLTAAEHGGAYDGWEAAVTD